MVGHRRCQLFRAGREGVTVKEALRLDHEGSKLFRIPGRQCFNRLVSDAFVNRSQQVLDSLLYRVTGTRKAPIQPGQDLHRVLLGMQVRDHQVHVSPHMQLGGDQPVSVERHQYGTVAKGAALVHAPAPRGGSDLTLVGQLHLAPCSQLQVIQLVESPRCQYADGCAGRQAFLDGQVGSVVMDHQAFHVVVDQRLVCNAGDIAPKATALGFFQQNLGVHWNLAGPVAIPLRRGGRQHQRSGMGRNLSIDTLVGATDQSVAPLDPRVHPAVSPGPIRVLTQ